MSSQNMGINPKSVAHLACMPIKSALPIMLRKELTNNPTTN